MQTAKSLDCWHLMIEVGDLKAFHIVKYASQSFSFVLLGFYAAFEVRWRLAGSSVLCAFRFLHSLAKNGGREANCTLV